MKTLAGVAIGALLLLAGATPALAGGYWDYVHEDDRDDYRPTPCGCQPVVVERRYYGDEDRGYDDDGGYRGAYVYQGDDGDVDEDNGYYGDEAYGPSDYDEGGVEQPYAYGGDYYGGGGAIANVGFDLNFGGRDRFRDREFIDRRFDQRFDHRFDHRFDQRFDHHEMFQRHDHFQPHMMMRPYGHMQPQGHMMMQHQPMMHAPAYHAAPHMMAHGGGHRW